MATPKMGAAQKQMTNPISQDAYKQMVLTLRDSKERPASEIQGHCHYVHENPKLDFYLANDPSSQCLQKKNHKVF